MKFEITIPSQFKDVKQQNDLVFIALLYKLSLTYGKKPLYTLYNTDVRTILGINGYYPHLYIQEQEWSKWLEMADVADDRYAYRLKRFSRIGKGDEVAKVMLTDERCVMVWLYLMGCFNNNLVEGRDHKKTKGLSKEYRTILTNGLDF